ncbi:MAG: PAS domain S-box protein [Deltaproteobacteria bacterium]|nr:PAS domain S-box protein [Deltaproteobacteria bacterium]
MKFPFWIKPAQSMDESPSQNWFYIEEDLLRRSRWLVLWRLVFISSFLFLTVFLHEKGDSYRFPFSFTPVYSLIALQYFFSILYLLILSRGKVIKGIAFGQLVIDGLFVTSVVYFTGGIESFFSYLYFLVILAAGILFPRQGGLLAALYVGVLYALLLLLQGSGKIPFYYGLVDQPASFSTKYLFYQVIMNGLGFFFVGSLNSIFAKQAQKQQSQIESQRKNIFQLEELNRIVIENLDIGLITLDRENKIQSINRAGEKILGRSPKDLLHKPLMSLFPDLNGGLDLNDTGEGKRMEAAYDTPDGAVITLGFSFNRVKENRSQGIGKIFSFKDISQIKIMENHLRQVDRLALIGKMAAGIAHEVRNPLASISGSIQVLKDDLKEKGTGERLLNIISREVTKLDSLMNDFLAFAKPVQVIESRLDISSLIFETVDLIKKNRRFSPTVVWQLDVAPDLFLKISAGELSQILWNLLLNALQAIPSDGEIFIAARQLRRENDEDWIEIKVKDNGSGISQENKAKIYEPFFTTKDRGTGLGLSIVQKLISDLGGIIHLESSPGKGTEFTVQFPKGAA